MSTTYKRRIAPVPIGDFDTTETYAVLDIVRYDGASYICKTAITTAGAWDAAKWQKICEDGAMGQDGSAADGITAAELNTDGEIVITVGMDTTLDPVRIAVLPKGEYSEATAYSFLDMIYFNGILYACNDTAGTEAGQSPSTHAAKWLAMSEQPTEIDGGNSTSFA